MNCKATIEPWVAFLVGYSWFFEYFITRHQTSWFRLEKNFSCNTVEPLD